MISVIEREQIRRAYYIEKQSMRQIAKEMGHGYWTIRKALASAEPAGYTLTQPKAAPKLGPYQAQIDQLLDEEAHLPRKQRYTSHRIYALVRASGYTGSESNLRRYVGQRRRALKQPAIFLPLEFDPGRDAQVDWGEAWVEMAGVRREVQLFVLRLCYSRKPFAMAFPTQRQEAFFTAHVAAFHYLGGVPHRLSYDNLKTAVRTILEGRDRQEQRAFIALRSHYLFESHFCTPGKGHEKGGVEHGVGYVRRNFLTPLPVVADFAELNRYLLACCDGEDQRQVDRQPQPIGEAWQQERPCLRPLPPTDFACCVSQEVSLNPYGQVVFETNRYSVPADQARPQLTVRAYPFQIEIVANHQVIARHERCYGRQQDILDPLHYLPLLAERPGAFEHAKPIRQWRKQWPPLYETLLSHLRQRHQGPVSAQTAASRAVREFIHILLLHQTYPAEVVEAAIAQALNDHIAHLEGVRFCLNRLLDPTPAVEPIDLSQRPHLGEVGTQPLTLAAYDQLLAGGAA